MTPQKLEIYIITIKFAIKLVVNVLIDFEKKIIKNSTSAYGRKMSFSWMFNVVMMFSN